MKFLILSKDGNGISLGRRIQSEGHDVDFFLQNPDYYTAGEGIVNRVTAWRPELRYTDLVVCDDVGFGSWQSSINKMRVPAIGCNRIGDLLSKDKARVIELCDLLRVQRPISIITSKEKGEAIKWNWESGPAILRGDTSIRCYDKDFYQFVISRAAEGKIVVQELLDGVSFGLGGWFNGRGWVEPFYCSFSERGLLENGEPLANEVAGTAVIVQDRGKLFEESLGKFTKFLSNLSYKGWFQLDLIVNGEGLIVLGAKTGLHYDTIDCVLETIQEPISDVLFEVAAGTRKAIKTGSDVALSVRVTVPPWPTGRPNGALVGMPILGLVEDQERHIAFKGVYKDEGVYHLSASDGVVMRVSARGRTMDEARQRAYRTIDNVNLPFQQVRRDIGSRVEKDLKTIERFGY